MNWLQNGYIQPFTLRSNNCLRVAKICWRLKNGIRKASGIWQVFDKAHDMAFPDTLQIDGVELRELSASVSEAIWRKPLLGPVFRTPEQQFPLKLNGFPGAHKLFDISDRRTS